MKKIVLSERLLAAASLVTQGNVLADIGTDHGYLPIWLCKEDRIPRALAMDVRPGPLSHAARNIQEAELTDRIETRLSDGLAALSPGEAQSISICGMGGALICRILKDGEQTAKSAEELILGAQSEVPEVRAFLCRSGWHIEEERMILEDGKYYPLIRAVKGSGPVYTDLELAFGPCLLKKGDPVLAKYLVWHRGVLEKIRASLGQAASGEGSVRLTEILDEIDRTERAMEYIAKS